MRLKENTYVKGNVHIKVLDKNKKVKEEKEIKNLVVDTGIEYIRDRMVDVIQPVMSHMAAGSNQTLQSSENLTLGDELGRVALDLPPEKVGIDKIVYKASFPPGEATGPLREIGIFNDDNDPNSGTMLCRTTFDVVNKGEEDTILINWTIFLFSDEDLDSNG